VDLITHQSGVELVKYTFGRRIVGGEIKDGEAEEEKDRNEVKELFRREVRPERLFRLDFIAGGDRRGR